MKRESWQETGKKIKKIRNNTVSVEIRKETFLYY